MNYKLLCANEEAANELRPVMGSMLKHVSQVEIAAMAVDEYIGT